mgnify:CR=1 FL=1
MRYLKDRVTSQFEINKSLFIAVLWPIQDKKSLERALMETKTLYPGANHYCSASLFDDGASATQDDDGEPERTAGFPILEVLKHHDVTNIACVVVRYFGGIKLGAGGLVRSYTKAAADAMKRAQFVVKKKVLMYRLTFGYPLISTVDAFFEKKGDIIEKTFLEDVSYTVLLHDRSNDALDDLRYRIKTVEFLGEKDLYVDE